jgi:hypothetical protein
VRFVRPGAPDAANATTALRAYDEPTCVTKGIPAAAAYALTSGGTFKLSKIDLFSKALLIARQKSLYLNTCFPVSIISQSSTRVGEYTEATSPICLRAEVGQTAVHRGPHELHEVEITSAGNGVLLRALGRPHRTHGGRPAKVHRSVESGHTDAGSVGPGSHSVLRAKSVIEVMTLATLCVGSDVPKVGVS